jgi:hypothetical protein
MDLVQGLLAVAAILFAVCFLASLAFVVALIVLERLQRL